MVRHLEVYRRSGRFAAWPANFGIWSWRNEIVVGFTSGHTKPGRGFHALNRAKPFATMQARSMDGGETWRVAPSPVRTPGNQGICVDEHVIDSLTADQAIEQDLVNVPQDPPGDIDFAHPDFALLCARTGLGTGTRSWFYVSDDRCNSWAGPYNLPAFGLPGVEARTDYLVSGPETCTLFLTASKTGGEEGGGVFCARTSDGGASFRFLSWIAQSEEGHAIMPSSIGLSEGRILCAVRCRGRGTFTGAGSWIDLFASDDDCESWTHLTRPVPDTGKGGNPPALIALKDGRLCLVYGYRREPYGMRARVSSDDGESWSDDIVLRNDGGNHDLGYPCAVQRPDGQVVAVYYYNEDPEGDRYIGATIFRP